MKRILVVVLQAVAGWAQVSQTSTGENSPNINGNHGNVTSKPGPEIQKAQGTPKLSEVSELRILTAFQKALIAQQDFKLAQQTMNEQVNYYNQICANELKTGGFSEGTRCAPDVNTGKVTTVPPPVPPKESKKEEPKPPDKK
jgi:hypothetical protein